MSDHALNQTAEVLEAIAAGMPRCPICAGRNVRRSVSVRFEDKVLGWLRYNPFRCRTCQHRFYKRPEPQRSVAAAEQPRDTRAAG